MTERPNKQALSRGLDIYRDAMRPFIIRNLKRLTRLSVEEAIRSALGDYQSNRFDQNLREGRAPQTAIDINDFPKIVQTNWKNLFSGAFAPGSTAKNTLAVIRKARDDASHPDDRDLDIDYVCTRLYDIAQVLRDINAPDRAEEVQRIRQDLIQPSADLGQIATENAVSETPVDPMAETTSQSFRTPAYKFQQGGRDVYSFALDTMALDALIPDRLDDRVVKDANRPLTQSHARNIQKYLVDREDWLLGALLLGISGRAVEYKPYPGAASDAWSVGELVLGLEATVSMKMFDGQHRRRAIKNVLDELSHSVRHSHKLASMQGDSLPIMLYVEEDTEALRQMFADAAKTRPIERNTVTRFDQRDAFNLAALWLAENSDLFSGRVEMERPSVPRSSTNIIAVNQLAMTLKTLEAGYGSRIRKERNKAYLLNLDELKDRCRSWADDFMPAAREEYDSLMSGEMDTSEIPEKRAESMAFNASVIRILAACHHEWTKNSKDTKPLEDFLRETSLKPGAGRGSLLVDAGFVAPGGTSPVGQSTQVAVQTIRHIVRRASESTK